MCKIIYHASHEQFAPSELLRWSVLARQAGFDAIHSSDHLQPWSSDQGESGHAFTWLGAAMQACALPFGVVCAAGPRHHPIILSQAIATLCEMFSDRLWVAFGSGEAINERVTGEPWPSKDVRNERLFESFHLIRQLLEGEEVTHQGHYTLKKARLYTLPTHRPRLFGAALSEETARWMGSWAEGLLTINHPLPQLKNVIQAFLEGGGKGKPIYVKVQLSYARNENIAYREAHRQWRNTIFESDVLSELWHPEQFDAIGRFVRPEDVKQFIHISHDLSQHLAWLETYLPLGVDALILHNVNRGQEDFINDFGREVLPHL